jgi:uncharacterized DUF497 family protein
MKAFAWDEEKNELLKRGRGVSFEDVVYHINKGDLLARLDHPNSAKYPHQQVFVICIDAYVYTVPFVEDDDKFFLKTIIPSRKLTRDYLKERKDDHETE